MEKNTTKSFLINYYYLATGMEGIPDTHPEQIIQAESREKAIYNYFTEMGVDFGSFDEYLTLPEWHREWGINCKEVPSTIDIKLSNKDKQYIADVEKAKEYFKTALLIPENKKDE